MVIMQKLRWAVFAGIAVVVSGCVAPPPQGAYQPVAYNNGTAQPGVPSSSLPQYYEGTAPQQNVAYAQPYYQPRRTYVEPYYYAPAFPLIGASLAYGLYDNDRHYHSRHKHHSKKRHGKKHRHNDGDTVHDAKGHKHKKDGKKHASKRVKHKADGTRAQRKADKRARRALMKKRRLLIEQQLRAQNKEGQRASDGN